MKLEDQVCSLELAKRLKKLGVKQESYFDWLHQRETNDFAIFPSYPSEPGWDIKCSAFTVAELGEMLKQPYASDGSYFFSMQNGHGWCGYKHVGGYWHDMEGRTQSDTEADARAKMLIYLIENKLVGKGKV